MRAHLQKWSLTKENHTVLTRYFKQRTRTTSQIVLLHESTFTEVLTNKGKSRCPDKILQAKDTHHI